MQRGPKVTGKWAQKFLDRIEEMSDGKDEIEEKTAVLEKEATAKPRRMPKMLAVVQAMKKHREDEINENPMLAKLLSLKKATTTTLCNWEPQWDNQLVCLYCDTPAIHNCIQCSYCDVVIHNSCLFEYASQIDEYVLHSADGKTFCCCDCMDAQVWHRTAVSGVYQKYKDDQQREDAALLITSNIREYVERKIKLEYVRAVVLLQAKYRCKNARDTATSIVSLLSSWSRCSRCRRHQWLTRHPASTSKVPLPGGGSERCWLPKCRRPCLPVLPCLTETLCPLSLTKKRLL